MSESTLRVHDLGDVISGAHAAVLDDDNGLANVRPSPARSRRNAPSNFRQLFVDGIAFRPSETTI